MELIGINIIMIGYIAIKLLYFNFDTNINTPPFRLKIHKKTVQAMIASGMVIDGLLCILGADFSWIVVGILFDVILFSDALYMRYYKNPLTISVMIHQFKLVKGIKESVFGVFLKKDLIYFTELPFLIAISITLKKLNVELTFKLSYGGLTLIVGLIWFIYIYKVSNRKSYFWNKKRMARDLGVLYYHLEDVVHYFKVKLRKVELTKDEKEKINSSFWKRRENEYSNIAKDKNLIVLQLESMQDFLINRTIEGREITPNLNKLMKESVRFENMYYQTSVGNTSDAELIVNNSLFPLADKPACYECQTNQFKSVGHSLKSRGYHNVAFHGNQASFWNRHLMYQLYGFDKFVDNSMLDNDEFIFPGLSDRSFFRQVVGYLAKKSVDSKIFAFLITLSLHHPYEYFANYDFSVGKQEGTFIGRYIKGAHYADQAIGKFIEDLKEKGLYEDSLLVMYGDHAGIPRQYRQEFMDFLELDNVDYNWTKFQKVAACMHLPGQKQGKGVTKAVGQIDILPTISNMMDLEISCALGKDMLDNTSFGGIVNREGVVVTDYYVSYPTEEYAQDIQTGEKIAITEEMKSEIINLREKLQISDLILEKNALKE